MYVTKLYTNLLVAITLIATHSQGAAIKRDAPQYLGACKGVSIYKPRPCVHCANRRYSSRMGLVVHWGLAIHLGAMDITFGTVKIAVLLATLMAVFASRDLDLGRSCAVVGLCCN